MRKELIRMRRGTRAELEASTSNFKDGEPYFITDEGNVVVAALDAPADENIFMEIGNGVKDGGILATGHTDPTQITVTIAGKLVGSSENPVALFTSGGAAFINGLGIATHFHLSSSDGGFGTRGGKLFINGYRNLTGTVGGTAGVQCLATNAEDVYICNNPNLRNISLSGSTVTGYGMRDIFIENNPSLRAIAIGALPDTTTIEWGSTLMPYLNFAWITSNPNLALSAIQALYALVSNHDDGVLDVSGCTTLLADGGWPAHKAEWESKGWTVSPA